MMQDTVSMVMFQKCMKPRMLTRQATTTMRTVNDVTKWPMKMVVVMNTHSVDRQRSLYSSLDITWSVSQPEKNS